MQPSDNAFANFLEVVSLHGYCCYQDITSQSLTPLFKLCHILTLCIGSFLLQDMFLKFLSLGLRGKKFREHLLGKSVKPPGWLIRWNYLVQIMIKIMPGACQK